MEVTATGLNPEETKERSAGVLWKVLSRPRSIIAFGFGIFTLYVFLGLFFVPLPERIPDTINWDHWVASNFTYASSAIDLSVISPFEGLGGLMQPLGIWLNPSD